MRAGWGARGRGRGRTSFSVAAGGVVALAAVCAAVPPAAAQDIEASARPGVQVPQGYYDRVAADPSAFRLPNGLFPHRTTVPARAPERRAAGRLSRVSGTHRLLVIPALFSDSQDPHISRDQIQQSLFDGPAERGTVREAYLEISRGALTLLGTVMPWVRTSITMAAAVGSSNGLGDDADLGPYFIEALELSDDSVDFGLYDNDGPDGIPNSGDDDGYVDAMTFEFLEVAGSCGGPSIWPHRWGISGWTGGQPWTSQDASANGGRIRVDGYIVQSVADCSGQRVQDANVIAHEYGHVLGMPDYYHPTASGGAAGRRWVLGCFELMAAGSWGCGPWEESRDPFGPTHMSPRTKNALGWLEYFEVGSVRDHEVFLDPVQESGKALKIPLDSAEFLIVEYRAQTGFDAQLPADGILIYHQDENGQLRPNPTSNTPYFVALVEQDASNGLQRNHYEGGDRGVAEDMWGVGGESRRYHFATAPSLRTNDGLATSVVIHEIAVEDGRGRLRLSTAETPEVIPPEGGFDVSQVTAFEERLRIAGGTMPYTPRGVVPDGVLMSTQGDELVVSGSVTGPGPFALVMGVEDAKGNQSPQFVVELNAEAWTVTVETLLQFFLGGDAPALTHAERAYLDALGNANGQYDVGDLRKWLRELGG